MRTCDHKLSPRKASLNAACRPQSRFCCQCRNCDFGYGGARFFNARQARNKPGVKAPSLYNHIACLQTLKMHLTARAFSLLLDQTRDAMAGIAGEQTLVAFGQTQRRFAKVHPGLWSAVKLPHSGWNEAAQHAADAYLALALLLIHSTLDLIHFRSDLPYLRRISVCSH